MWIIFNIIGYMENFDIKNKSVELALPKIISSSEAAMSYNVLELYEVGTSRFGRTKRAV
jgi:hypothetical protein